MTVVTLTFTSSITEIVSGIPETLDITSNIPSTIYYTMDGTTPTLGSPMYTSTINMPDNTNSVTISAFGVGSDDIAGTILTQIFAPDTTRITISRNVGAEGFVISRAGVGPNTEDGFDADGYVARFIDVDLETLDIIRKKAGRMGLGEGTAVEIGIPDPDDTASFVDDGFVARSTPLVGENFNPYAQLIVIDNRQDNDINLMLRPHGSLSNIYREAGGKRIRSPADDATYISGGFVRRFYSVENNIMVSYYFDHNEARYVKNIQELPSGIQGATNFGVRNGTQPLVFQWMERGRHSSI